MKIETLGGAAIAAAILFITGFLAVFQQEGIGSVKDIAEGTWWVLLGGAILSFAKDYQALSARRFLARMSGSGNVHSPAAVGILAILLACFALSGCAAQRPQIDSIADGIAVTAADVETAAQTVRSLCRNLDPGGPCAAGALISTTQKESLKNGLQDVLDSLSLANLALAMDDYPGARTKLARTQAILAVLSAELARMQQLK
ncbi:MAG: hypothetical protein IIB77_02385 [Proteobacteria bacterium]|nr:hypothetical protein [Pseudomonadota bacterium]